MHHQPASHQYHERATTSSSQQQPAAACSSQRHNTPVTNRSRTQQPAAAPQQPPSRQPAATHQPPSSQTAASHQPPSTKPAARPRATAGTSPPPAHGRGCIADARTTHLSNARPPPSPPHASAPARRRQGHAGREPSYVPAMRTPHLRRIPHVHTGCHPQGPKLTSYTAPTSTTGRCAHGPDPRAPVVILPCAGDRVGTFDSRGGGSAHTAAMTPSQC